MLLRKLGIFSIATLFHQVRPNLRKIDTEHPATSKSTDFQGVAKLLGRVSTCQSALVSQMSSYEQLPLKLDI